MYIIFKIDFKKEAREFCECLVSKIVKLILILKIGGVIPFICCGIN